MRQHEVEGVARRHRRGGRVPGGRFLVPLRQDIIGALRADRLKMGDLEPARGAVLPAELHEEWHVGVSQEDRFDAHAVKMAST